MVSHLVPPPAPSIWIELIPKILSSLFDYVFYHLWKKHQDMYTQGKTRRKIPNLDSWVDHRDTCWPLPLIKYDFTQYITVSACMYVIWEQGRSRFSIGFGSMRLFLEYRSQPWPSLSPPGWWWSWMDPGPVVVCFMTSLGIPSWSLSASGSLFNSRIYRSIMGLSVTVLTFGLEL